MTTTRKTVKQKEVDVGKMVDKVEDKTSADKASDQEWLNNARKALREYWLECGV